MGWIPPVEFQPVVVPSRHSREVQKGSSTKGIKKNDVLLAACAAVACATQAQAIGVYNNLAAASSLDLSLIWCDLVTLTQGGVLDRLSFTIFSSTNGGAIVNPILTATVRPDLFDNTVPYTTGDLQTLLSSFAALTSTINFGAGLNPGILQRGNR